MASAHPAADYSAAGRSRLTATGRSYDTVAAKPATGRALPSLSFWHGGRERKAPGLYPAVQVVLSRGLHLTRVRSPSVPLGIIGNSNDLTEIVNFLIESAL